MLICRGMTVFFPPKIYHPLQIGPSSPQNYFYLALALYFSARLSTTLFFSDVFPAKQDFMGKIPVKWYHQGPSNEQLITI